MKSLWAHGAVRIIGGTNDITINEARAQVTYKPVFREYENLQRKIIRTALGYRVIIDVTILNIDDTTAEQMATLMNIINDHNGEITVYPRYESGDPRTLIIPEMYIDGVVSPKDLDMIEIGQELTVSFMSASLHSLPDILGESDEVGDLSDETGNQIVDASGNILELFV